MKKMRDPNLLYLWLYAITLVLCVGYYFYCLFTHFHQCQ